MKNGDCIGALYTVLTIRLYAHVVEVNIYIYIYIYIYIVEEGLDGHGLLLLRVSRVMRSHNA